MKILQIPILNLTRKQTTSFINKCAVRNKDFALFLCEKGLKDRVSEEFTDTLLKGVFNEKGNLSEKGERLIKSFQKILNIREDVTIKTFIKKLLVEMDNFEIKFSNQEVKELEKLL